MKTSKVNGVLGCQCGREQHVMLKSHGYVITGGNRSEDNVRDDRPKRKQVIVLNIWYRPHAKFLENSCASMNARPCLGHKYQLNRFAPMHNLVADGA